MLASLLHPSSYLGIFIFLVLTGCGMPVPEEVAIVLAGVLSAAGELHAGYALVACIAGAIAGDSMLYFLGRWGGRRLAAYPALARFLPTERDPRLEKSIEQHSFKVLFLSRFLVGIRGPVYLTAGAVRMSYRRFLFIDLVCATLVVGTFFSLAYFFGDDVANWIRTAEKTATLVVVLAILAVGGLLYYRHRQLVMQMLFGNGPGQNK